MLQTEREIYVILRQSDTLPWTIVNLNISEKKFLQKYLFMYTLSAT